MHKEAQIEKRLIEKLQDLKYIYRPDIRDRDMLEGNFRSKFEELNGVKLSDTEFSRLLENIVKPDTFAASKTLREQNTFLRENGSALHYSLVNTKDWCKNDYEVINQLRINTHNSHHRYDVILLINGIPVVQIELKDVSVVPRKAMEQIVEYKNDPGNGYLHTLMCFVQLFVVSNQTNTHYFTNNNNEHFRFNADEQFLPIYQLAGEKNKKINHLDDFSELFLAKCTLGEMISRYMVLVECEQKLIMMRPYQVAAVRAIVNCIHENRGNGYVWHTTGSGKTLTSFKASTLLKSNPDIEKCFFVVDRKDLDRQTREEFNKFQENCVEENTNTETLVRRMLSADYADKVIVSTIQKLGLALDPSNPRNYKERLLPLSKKRVVFIFDECHRSQFGENHKAITEFFPNAQLFGFTGTPIFDENATYTQINGEEKTAVTTKDIFRHQLHAYTITHAIDDRNVLKFHIDYFEPKGNDSRHADGTLTKQAVIHEILKKHPAATNQRQFNAILATASIADAIEYYDLFKTIQQKRQAEDADFVPLNVVCVFSPPSEGNKDVQQIQEDLPQEKADNQHEPDVKKKALTAIIDDYNRQYGSNHSINEFDSYYQDVQKRIKDQKYSNKDVPHAQKIDLTIVVDMLLTGFDSKYLNTLYVDKNLKYHGLIQAFSRTNRILNKTKPHGNILDFRGQQAAVDTAIAMFSGEKSEEQARQIWLVEPAPVVIEKYAARVEELNNFMQAHGLECKPQEVNNLRGDVAKVEFINRFKEVQRLKTKLDQYTDIEETQKAEINTLLPEEDWRAFKGAYLELAQQLREEQPKPSASPEVQQLDFEFVLFASAIIDYDYIMGLLAKNSGVEPRKRNMTKEQLIGLIASSANMMDERENLEDFITKQYDALNGKTEQEIRAAYQTFKAEKFAKEIAEIAARNELETAAVQRFVETVMQRMIFDADTFDLLFAPFDLGWKAKKQRQEALMHDLCPLLKKLSAGREISGLSAWEE
ncbi:MAG: type I restriction endonuclease subunit R [Bacteroidales bacterium]|jgi:type I restriction enzyme R subunit|nr:type I restriction endonuclease subunit R [Bacteroidales bacterium]